MKFCTPLLLLFSLLFSPSFSNNILTPLESCSEHDFVLIANALYFSAQRSLATLTVHKAWREDQEIMRKLSENIEHTRRNPSKKMPHIIPSNDLLSTRTACIQAFEFYARASGTYARCVNTLVVDNKELFHDQSIHKLLEEIRQQARFTVAQELARELPKIKDLLTQAYTTWSKQFNHEVEHFDTWYESLHRSLLETLADYVPSVSMQALVYLDRELVEVSKKTWAVMLQSTDAGIYVWDAIEKIRFGFYQMLYHQASLIACKRGIIVHELFTENGIIPPAQRTNALPEAISPWIF